MSSADICQHAVRKRAASEAGAFRPSKKNQATASMQTRAAASTPTEELDALSALVSEPVLALSAPTVLPAVPFEERTVRGTIEATSVVPPTEEVWAEVGGSE